MNKSDENNKNNRNNKKNIKGCFICFTGIDGSGKSTISNKLVETMNDNGFNFAYVYNRYTPFLLRPFLYIGGKLFLNKKDFFEDYVDYSNTKKDAAKDHTILSSMYQYFVVIDYFLQTTYKIKIPLMLGKNIICDRYIYDTVVTDLAVDFNYTEDKVLKVLNKILMIFPEPNKIFFIDVPEQVAFQRKDDVPSIDYLKDRVDFFRTVAKSHDFIKLDGTASVNDIMTKVKQNILG